MYYLLYEKEGLLKKFPLEKAEIVIGRGFGCDIALKDKAVSKRHCRVRVGTGQLEITDLGSRNGTFVGESQVAEARIAPNNSFGVGATEFYFKRGDIKEFAVSRSLSALYSTIARTRRPEKRGEPDTELRGDRLELALQSLAEKALLEEDFSRFLRGVRHVLDNSLGTGALFFVSGEEAHSLFDRMEMAGIDLPGSGLLSVPQGGALRIDGRDVHAWKFSSFLPEVGHFLLYLTVKTKKGEIPSTDFFQRLLEIIEVHKRLATGAGLADREIRTLFRDGQLAIIGESPPLHKAVELAKRIAGKSSFVLILGESGTGKELIARLIHQMSKRKSYVALNCAAIPAPLLESELFGYERGAFTDAKQRKIGKIEASSGGTLVLDEIGDMPIETQAKLLRVIQEKAITRVGGNDSIPVDLRIVAMTNQDLYRLVAVGKFREDLFFRLRVHQITIPPLRERREDIPHLIRHFTRVYSQKNNIVPAGFSESAEEVLTGYDWPGNIRELENEISRILETIDDGELISDHHLLPEIVKTASAGAATSLDSSRKPLREKMQLAEKSEIERLLRQNNGNKMKTAREMGISYRGFLKKVKRLGISD